MAASCANTSATSARRGADRPPRHRTCWASVSGGLPANGRRILASGADLSRTPRLTAEGITHEGTHFGLTRTLRRTQMSAAKLPSGRRRTALRRMLVALLGTGAAIAFAATALPDSTQITSGTFRPTNIGSPDPFPAPAPTGTPPGTYSSLLSSFNASNPNGTWRLFVFDDAAQDQGELDGWRLHLTARPNA